MTTALLFFGLLLLLGLLLVVGSALIGPRLLARDTRPDAIVEIPRSDGGLLLADRFLAKGGRRGVVITVHGLGANRITFDLDDGLSLVRTLAAAGYEVWNVDLRGQGRARGREPRRWSFDDHVRVDVPAMLAHVTAVAGVPSVHWVGHSMGGMIAYAWLGTHPDEARVASLCTLGSPMEPPPGLVNLSRLGALLGSWMPTLRVDLIARAAAMLALPVPLPLAPLTPSHFSGPMLRRLTWSLTEPLSGPLIAQLAACWRDGRLRSVDGVDDYRGGLARITTPLCVFAAPGDRLAPLHSARIAFDEVASPIREYHLLSREGGCTHDGCHTGMVLGQTAPAEVFPRILAWLDRARDP